MMRTFVFLSLFAATLGCLVLFAISGTVAQRVAQSAPAPTPAPAIVTQEATAVCVGLVNIGSCNVRQVAAGADASSQRGGNPWPVIFLCTAVIIPVALAALAMLPGRSETTAVEVRR